MEAPPQPLTEDEAAMLHRAGMGMWRPMGDAPTARAQSLVTRGFLGYNRATGIYFLTPRGADQLLVGYIVETANGRNRKGSHD